jgi:YVTN family beta-propeller protein
VGKTPTGIGVTPDGSRLYVANNSDNTVSVINTITNTVVKTISVGQNPQGVSITPDGKKVYVSCQQQGISIISTATNSVIATITVGAEPFSLGNFIANVVTPCETLPLRLLELTAKNIGNVSLLQWYTSTELNTSHFIIQHSTDGSAFTDIATVKAIGYGANGYQFTDNNPTTGINYYRLKSIDKDGSSSYSKIVSVQLTSNNYQLSISPNPAKDIVTVKGRHIAFVQVIDNMGKIIKTQVLKDATNPILSVGGLPAGVYHLRVQTTDGKVSAVGFVKE